MADINAAIAKTIIHEGGFQKRPNDRANWSSGKIGVGELIGTKYGITALDMPGVKIEDLTTDQATQYYKEHYVKDLYAQIVGQDKLEKIFDMGVLFGVGEAIILVQRALLLTQDGIFGPNTLAHVNGTDMLQMYKNTLVQHALKIVAVRPEDREDLAGWVKRINS